MRVCAHVCVCACVREGVSLSVCVCAGDMKVEPIVHVCSPAAAGENTSAPGSLPRKLEMCSLRAAGRQLALSRQPGVFISVLLAVGRVHSGSLEPRRTPRRPVAAPQQWGISSSQPTVGRWLAGVCPPSFSLNICGVEEAPIHG